MGDALESELDALFQRLPAQLVSARNALVQRLKKAGDKAAASRVAEIRRPTPAAWAINQVSFREAGLLALAQAQTARLRELHATRDVAGEQVAAALGAQRSALQAVVDAALRHCAQAGVGSGAALERQIHASLQGWLTGAAAELPGRMTRDLGPGGFEVLGEVAAVAKPAPMPARTPPEPRAAPRDDRRVEQAIEALAQSERQARAANELVSTRAREQQEADRELQRAQLAVQDAERALARQRTRLQEHEASSLHARSAAAEATTALALAEQAVLEARAALEALRTSET